MAPPLSAKARSPVSSMCRACQARLLTRHARRPFSRVFSSSPTPAAQSSDTASSSDADPATQPPRWARAPPAMRAPYKARPANKNDDFDVNEDPAVLDRALESMLGASVRGNTILEEEIKWLAVTHRSFDHGRRGMNDRLAFLGRRIVELQTSLALMHSPINAAAAAPGVLADPWGREATPDSTLTGIDKITTKEKLTLLAPARLARLADQYGLRKVIRWKPRQIHNLNSSGVDSVLAQTVYAIVGAVALQRGGEAAVQTVRERILRPLNVL